MARFAPWMPGFAFESTVYNDVVGSHYAASPGVCEAANGDLLVCYMRANDHNTTNDGRIEGKRSTDGGATWGTAFTIHNSVSDERDPDLTTLANGDIVCSFTDDAGGTSYTPKVTISTDDGTTWGSPISVTHSFTGYAYGSSRVVELPNGHLLWALYGIDTGDPNQSARVSRSTDGGATWAHLAEIVDGPAWSRDAQEPYLAYDATRDRVWCFIRSDTGTDTLYFSYSDDDGATWAAVTSMFAGSGRPAGLALPNGYLVVAYRDTSASNKPSYKFSTDAGASWSTALPVNSTATYEYASWWLNSDYSISMVWSVEIGTFEARVVYQRSHWFGPVTSASSRFPLTV